MFRSNHIFRLGHSLCLPVKTQVNILLLEDELEGELCR